MLPKNTEERIREKVSVNKVTGCWDWRGAKQPNGYGQLWNGQRPEQAHRVSYKLFVGDIPPDKEIDHKCENRSCVNPDHLQVLTHKNNIRKSNSLMGINSRKTHCKRGHPFQGRNLVINSAGFRQCRECINLHGRNAMRRKRA